MAIFRVPINIAFAGAGSPGANIWHIRTIGALGAAELSQANNLIGMIRTFYNSLAIHFPNSSVFTLGTVTEEETDREITPSWSPVAGAGANTAPQLLAACVTWKTGTAARRGRGRTFLGPLAYAVLEANGTPTATFGTALGSAASALVSASLADGNGAIGVYGYANPKTPGKENPRNPLDPRVLRDITGYATRDLFASLRSRRD